MKDIQSVQDPRSKEEILRQQGIIKNICSQNEQLFLPLVESERKTLVKKIPVSIHKMSFQDGRYLYYTDSFAFSEKDSQESPSVSPDLFPVILTVHGIPGSASDFKCLEENVQSRLSCRWINYLTPGLDREDERRGTYNGYLDDTSRLMNDFLDKLQIQNVILIMHSAGGVYAKYFAAIFPNRVKAIIQLASIGIQMWKPILFENQLFKEIGIDMNRVSRADIEKEEFRHTLEKGMQNFVKTIETFQESKKQMLQVYKMLSLTDHLMILKAQTSLEGGFGKFFELTSNLDRRIPRFFAYSTLDMLLDQTHIQQEIFHVLLSPSAVPFQLVAQSSDTIFKPRDTQNVLTSFIFEYQDVGHALQHHKAFDLSIKIIEFIKILPSIKPICHSNPKL